MDFNAQVKFLGKSKFPGRFYLHNVGIEVFGSNPISSARNELSSVLGKIDEDYLWVIGILWGDSGIPIVEVFAYNGIQRSKWPGNPEVFYFQFRSRQLVEDSRSLTCGDGLMILGREEEFRRHKRTLKEYINDAPRFSSGCIQNYL